MDRIQDVQKRLVQEKVDGWLLYDFTGSNPLARDFLQIRPDQIRLAAFSIGFLHMASRSKSFTSSSHMSLSALPGKTLIYMRWQGLEEQLGKILAGKKKVAMEYSPRNAVPYISKVDAGTVDLVRSFHVEVVSSGSFLQYYTCALDEEQYQTHKEAADVLDKTVAAAWEKISNDLRKGTPINEYQVQQFIAERIAAHGCMMEGQPIVGVNAHSADPHYEPKKEGSSPIRKGDFILIDLWCKKKHPRAIYADICRVGVADSKPTDKQKEVFTIVREAQKAATQYVIDRHAKGEKIRGCDVDQVSRKWIEERGYGKFFTHRTGHNIYTKDHGPGAHIDSLETQDLRELIPHCCFSVEPGIYLPDEFGVRLEYDLFLGDGGKVHLNGGVQESIVTLL